MSICADYSQMACHQIDDYDEDALLQRLYFSTNMQVQQQLSYLGNVIIWFGVLWWIASTCHGGTDNMHRHYLFRRRTSP
jgi:hypothetical protein